MPLAEFERNLDRAKYLVELEESLKTITTEVMDLSDLLRAALVLGVGAFDHFIHEHVRTEMLAVHSGFRPRTPAYERFHIPMGVVTTALTKPGAAEWLDEAIRANHGWKSFQHPRKIADAIKLISPVRVWQEVADELGRDPSSVKTQLMAIVDRRNKIAHEADMDPTDPGSRWPITPSLVRDALSFVK